LDSEIKVFNRIFIDIADVEGRRKKEEGRSNKIKGLGY